MSFLVILLGLIVTATWLKDVDRFDDAWFSRYQRALRSLAARNLESAKAQNLAGLVAVYGGLLIVVLMLEWFVAGRLYGLATMALHLLLLLVAMDRTQPGRLVLEFLRSWNAGDREGCVDYLKHELNLDSPPSALDGAAIVKQFKRLLVYRSFERMFMMYTLYLVLGPSGVVIGYVSYQLRTDLREEGDRECADSVGWLISLLEWIPLRLLALTFSLVGDFSRCFAQLRRQAWLGNAQLSNSELLAGWASCALSEAEAPCNADAPLVGADRAAGFDNAAMVLEVRELQGLVERSQLVWLVSVALLTLIGI